MSKIVRITLQLQCKDYSYKLPQIIYKIKLAYFQKAHRQLHLVQSPASQGTFYLFSLHIRLAATCLTLCLNESATPDVTMSRRSNSTII